MKKLTILGCGGFVGSHLLDLLFARTTVQVEGWDCDSAKIARHLDDPRLTFHREPIQSRATLAKLRRSIADSDAVVNLAAICNPSEYNTRPLDVIRGNFFDVYRIVELCSLHKTWLVHFSTSEVYGRTIASYLPDNAYADPALFELDEDTTPLVMGPIANQRWTYACAKQLMERLVFAHHKEHALPFTIIRPLNFFGPRMDYMPGRDGAGVPRVLACFMTALLDRKPMQLVDGGSARRTITSIYEAVEAVLRILERPAKSQNRIFNIGNRNNEVTIAELALTMRAIHADLTGDASYLNHPVESVSSRDFYGEGYEDCDRRMPKLDRARELLDWAPKSSLEEILRETMRYYLEHYGGGVAAARPAGRTHEARPRSAAAEH